jgi:hypothetical protein
MIKGTILNKGNNKITELRTILQRKVQTHNYINRQNQSTTGKLNTDLPDIKNILLYTSEIPKSKYRSS